MLQIFSITLNIDRFQKFSALVKTVPNHLPEAIGIVAPNPKISKKKQ